MKSGLTATAGTAVTADCFCQHGTALHRAFATCSRSTLPARPSRGVVVVNLKSIGSSRRRNGAERARACEQPDEADIAPCACCSLRRVRLTSAIGRPSREEGEDRW
jgi:hypothetical protein